MPSPDTSTRPRATARMNGTIVSALRVVIATWSVGACVDREIAAPSDRAPVAALVIATPILLVIWLLTARPLV